VNSWLVASSHSRLRVHRSRSNRGTAGAYLFAVALTAFPDVHPAARRTRQVRRRRTGILRLGAFVVRVHPCAPHILLPPVRRLVCLAWFCVVHDVSVLRSSGFVTSSPVRSGSVLVTLSRSRSAFPLPICWQSLPVNQQPADDSGAAAVLDVLLVRTTAWFVLLQDNGRHKRASKCCSWSTSVEAHLQPLRHGRSMTHIQLPFTLLPIYSVMKTIRRAMCARPVRWAPPVLCVLARLFPQTIPGSRRLPAHLHPVARILHHAALVGADRPDGQRLHRDRDQPGEQLGKASALARSSCATTILYIVYNRLDGVER